MKIWITSMSKWTPEMEEQASRAAERWRGRDWDAALDEIRRLRDEVSERQRTIDLIWDADQRAIAQWQSQHPDSDDIWPDRKELVLWLLGKLEAVTSAAHALHRPADRRDCFLEGARAMQEKCAALFDPPENASDYMEEHAIRNLEHNAHLIRALKPEDV